MHGGLGVESAGQVPGRGIRRDVGRAAIVAKTSIGWVEVLANDFRWYTEVVLSTSY
jgi:hypothetical protein